MIYERTIWKCFYKKMPKKVKEYMLERLGKEETGKLMRAIRTRQWIIIDGPECSGKSTIRDILWKLGYPYVLDTNSSLAVIIRTSDRLTDLKPIDDILEELEIGNLQSDKKDEPKSQESRPKISLDDYLKSVLPKGRGISEIKRCMKNGRSIYITGEERTGKTTLKRVLKNHGCKAIEDFDPFHIHLTKQIPIDEMIPNYYLDIV